MVIAMLFCACAHLACAINTLPVLKLTYSLTNLTTCWSTDTIGCFNKLIQYEALKHLRYDATRAYKKTHCMLGPQTK